MGVSFDRWTLLKLFEVVAAVACLTFKRVTDDEASRLFLYLQKISREWSLLNNVTWDRIGASVADATYGGYVIITAALFLGRLTGELPTRNRITEFVLLGLGALLFIVLGSLELASIENVPENLVDNAAILGALSLITAAMFLLDMGGPKARKTSTHSQTPPRSISKPQETRTITQQVLDIEKEIERTQQPHTHVETPQMRHPQKAVSSTNGHLGSNGLKTDPGGRYRDNGYKQMRDERPKTFGIYGKDVMESDTDEAEELPPKMEEHSPVWSKIRKGQYGKYDIITPYQYNKGKTEPVRPPSGPGDPGYVQYTAQHWGEPAHKTPRHSPTQV